MRLDRLLDSVMVSLGGQPLSTLKVQAEALKAANQPNNRQPAANRGRSVDQINPFLQTLNNLGPNSLPVPPTNPANAEQLNLYNQQLLQYINRLNAQQALVSQRLMTQISQLTLALQRNAQTAGSAALSAGNNTQYPTGSALSQLSGVVRSQPDSLLLAESSN